MKLGKTLSIFFMLALVVAVIAPVASYSAPVFAPRVAGTDAPAAPEVSGSWQRVWRGQGAVEAFVGIDAQSVLGVGSQGMILNTTDGGVTWHYQSPVPDKDLHDIVLVGNRAWTVGQDGIVLGSIDGGATWQQLASGLAPGLNGVDFVDSANGWVVGEGGTLLHSTDGGATWTPQPSGVGTALNAVRVFADGQHGVVVGDKGVVLTTSDGGSTWTPRPGVGNAVLALRDIHIEGNQAWLVGDGGVLRYSNDQGAIWNTRNSLGFNVHEIEFAPMQDKIGWVAGVRVSGGREEERIMRTTDGGNTWALIGPVAGSDFVQQRDCDPDAYEICQIGTAVTALGVSDVTHAWVGGGADFKNREYLSDEWIPRQTWYVWRTSNGATWQHMIGGFYPYFNSVDGATDAIAYLVGDDLNVLKTTDGGNTWRELANELRANPDLNNAENRRGTVLHGVSCTPEDPNDCHVSGKFAVIAHTTDGGETWAPEYPPNYGNAVYDIDMTSKMRGVALGRGDHYYTTNGMQWLRTAGVATKGGTGLDVDMVSDNEGGRASKKNTDFLYTTNGGQAWRAYQMPVNYRYWQMNGFDAYDADADGKLDNGWLAGCVKGPWSDIDFEPCSAAAILHNPNVLDPEGWQAYVIPESPLYLQRISMVDTTTGWASGELGYVLFTEDSGETWTRQIVPAAGWLNALDAYSRNLAYAAGEEGIVLRYAQPDRRLIAGAQNVVAIDGDLSDWSTAYQRTINSEDVDFISGEHPTPTDVSADVRIRWDDRLFYVSAHVTDDVVMTGDRFGIAFDGLQDGVKGADDHTLLFGADGALTVNGAAPPAGWAYAVHPVSGGYDIEASLPPSALGANFVHLRKMGVNVALTDADEQGQEPVVLIWVGNSLDGDPAEYGELTFLQFDRQQPNLDAYPAGAFAVDGDLSDWSADGTFVLNAAAGDSVQGPPPGSDADLSSTLRLRWWSDYLFFGLHVSDQNLTAGDALQINFDPSGDARPGNDDHELLIHPDGSVTDNGQEPQGVLAVGRIVSGGYEMEVAIPAAWFTAPPYDAYRTIDFNYGLLDDDNGDGVIEHRLNWQGASVGGIQADYGSLTLLTFETKLKATPGSGNVQDTTLDEWKPATNYGNFGFIGVRAGNAQTGVIRFDLDGLPAGAQIKRALLRLYRLPVADTSGSLDVTVFRLLRGWTEMQATWNQAANSSPWGTPGASGPGDRAATPSTQGVIPVDNVFGSFDVTADVQKMVVGETPNYGWLLQGDAGMNKMFQIASSNVVSPTNARPEMAFEYTLPGGMVATATPWATPTATATATPTATPTSTSTSTPTTTPTLTSTPTDTPTATPTSTPTSTLVPVPVWLPLIRS